LRQEVTQTITLQQKLGPEGTIIAAGQPLRSGLPLTAVVAYITREGTSASSTDAEGLPTSPGDASVLYSRKKLAVGDSYQVVSSLSVVDQESLRGAGTAYPSWVVPRYLQLPETLPERVSSLAEQITAGLETPYDKAVAVESYLRQLPYNEQIEGPAPGQDGVDYFLFEAQQGYCDYYASAMVVMLRSVGVPARYVRGFSQGAKVEGAYHILERDGHAWPELFFPNYGWVEFEPTAGEPVLIRPVSQQNDAAGLGGERPPDERDRGPDDLFEGRIPQPMPTPVPETFLQRIGWFAVGILVVALLVAGLTVALALRRQQRIEGLHLTERVYEDLVSWSSRLLKIRPLAHQTPNEYGSAVVEALPTGRQPVSRIIESYVGYRFGGQAVDENQVQEAWAATQRVLWRRWLQRRGERVRTVLRRVLFAPPKEPGQGQQGEPGGD
jgi:transglutaminase-like putative cysteine protease